MTLDEARAHVGERVLYSTWPGEADEGVITGVNGAYAFVRYGRDTAAKATRPEDLALLRGGSVAEHFRLGMLEAGFPLTSPELS
jgi:hypothetical protein